MDPLHRIAPSALVSLIMLSTSVAWLNGYRWLAAFPVLVGVAMLAVYGMVSVRRTAPGR